MLKNKKLAFKLSFFILTFTAFVFAAIFAYNYKVSRDFILKDVEINANNLTYSTANKIESVLLAVQKIPQNFARMLENSTYNEEELKSMIKAIAASNPEICGSCVAFEPEAFISGKKYFAMYANKNASGEVSVNQIGSESYEYFYLDWYQLPKELQKPVWTEPYFDEGAGNAMMSTYAVPFYYLKDGRKALKGIVTIDVSLDWLEKIMSSIKIFNSGYGFLISRFGNIITHPDKKLIMNESVFSLADEFEKPLLREIGRKMINGEAGFYPVNNIMMKGDCWLYFVPLKSACWSLAVIVPDNELFADLKSLMNIIITFALIGMISLFFMIIYISNKVTGPLKELAEVTKILGAGNFDVKLPEISSNDEVGTLNKSFVAMQKALKQYILNLEASTKAKEKIQSELKIARDIQMGIIPKIFPPFPDRQDIDIYAILQPAKEVGGDLYDFFFIDDDLLCFVIGDVSDKGVPASLFMAITRTLLRAKSAKGMKPGEILKAMNDALSQDNENSMFVTFFLGILNLKTGVLEYANAGHNPPYILHKDFTVEEFPKPKDIPLGIIEREFSYSQLNLIKGEAIFLFTDGLNEAIDKNGGFYGDPRVVEMLAKVGPQKTREITETLLNDLKDFTKDAEQSDDITMMSIKYY